MPEFGSSFSGLANDRKLTNAELIRAIRFMVAAEYEATQLYIQLATTSQVSPQCYLKLGVFCLLGWLFSL